jgi:hypothetical protein
MADRPEIEVCPVEHVSCHDSALLHRADRTGGISFGAPGV